MKEIRLRHDGAVARILIDNPARRNAMSRAMWRALPGLLAAATARRATRVVTLQSGVEGAFCAGADIAEFESTYRDPAGSMQANAEIQDAVRALAAIPIPTLALVDGPCVGGGVALILACDLRLAGDRATFAVTPARLGLSYHPEDVGSLVAACGRAGAAELLFTSRRWSAGEALAAGLVNRVSATEGFVTDCTAITDAIAANSVDALRALKETLAAVHGGGSEARARAADRFEALFAGRDFLEGRDAFLQKRPARFPSHQDDPEQP
jgi:enoyl-CoA hydratase/carnithine racemase